MLRLRLRLPDQRLSLGQIFRQGVQFETCLPQVAPHLFNVVEIVLATLRQRLELVVVLKVVDELIASALEARAFRLMMLCA